MAVFCFCLPASVLSQEEFVYDAKGIRNPFVPLITSDGRLLQIEKTESEKGAIVLEGIICDQYGLSFAIVNGLVIKEGDFVGDNRVLKIEKSKVVFIKDGVISEVELKKEGQ